MFVSVKFIMLLLK